MKNSKIQRSNPDGLIKEGLINSITEHKETSEQNIMFGFVVDNTDPLNANRIKVKVPVVDDHFFENKEFSEGVNNLPWCLPFNRNFINTPETNSVVSVIYFNTKTPSVGRVYMDALTDLNKKELFDISRLDVEEATYLNFENAEVATNTKIQVLKEEKEVEKKVKYEVGIKGKGKNKVLLKKESVEITQNEGEDRSEIIIDKNVNVKSSDKIKIVSNKGKTEYHPVFHKPLYDYIEEMNGLLKSIITIMSTMPSINTVTGTPNTPSPDSMQLVTKLVTLYKKFEKLKMDGEGHSKYISIN